MKYHCISKMSPTKNMLRDIILEGYRVWNKNHVVFVKDADQNIYLVRSHYPYPLAALGEIHVDPTYEYVLIKDKKKFTQIVGGYMIKETGELIYSSHRHDMAWDATGKYFVDGGKEYVRTNIMNDDMAVRVEIDLFNNTFTKPEEYGEQITYPFEYTD